MDHGLNPRLARGLVSRMSEWMDVIPTFPQLLLTSHNPLVLDGLPIGDDRVRLFTVDRDTQGRTVVDRIELTDKIKALSEKGWTLSRMWVMGHLGGVPNV